MLAKDSNKCLHRHTHNPVQVVCLCGFSSCDEWSRETCRGVDCVQRQIKRADGLRTAFLVVSDVVGHIHIYDIARSR